METIGEVGIKYASDIFDNMDCDTDTFGREDIEAAVEYGAAFAQRWINVEEELPTAIEAGCWAGMRSDFVLAKDDNGEWYKAMIYTGFVDGFEFCNWVDQNGYDIDNIVEWRPIELK